MAAQRLHTHAGCGLPRAVPAHKVQVCAGLDVLDAEAEVIAGAPRAINTGPCCSSHHVRVVDSPFAVDLGNGLAVPSLRADAVGEGVPKAHIGITLVRGFVNCSLSTVLALQQLNVEYVVLNAADNSGLFPVRPADLRARASCVPAEGRVERAGGAFAVSCGKKAGGGNP